MHPKPSNPVKRRAPPVTAIIGFASKDNIVLASDSQTTTAEGAKLSMRKIHRICFGEKTAALVAIAGVVDGAEAFLEAFESGASNAPVDHWRSIANCAEAAMKEARQRINDGFRNSAVTPEQCFEHLENRYCQILLAYYFNKTPHLFVLDSRGAIAIKSTRAFVASGSGSTIAGSILKEFNFQDMDTPEAWAIAVYTIEACKRADLHCSGLCQVGQILLADNQCSLLTESTVRNMESAAATVHATVQKELSKQITKQFLALPMEWEDWG